MNTGNKNDQGKIRMDLLPTSMLTSVGKVLTHGAKTYGENTWQEVNSDRYIAALLRHFVKFMDDPLSIDEESGLLHIEHVLCNAAFLNDKTQKILTQIVSWNDAGNKMAEGMVEGMKEGIKR